MGRELKRVPLDFAWPRGEIWGGYLNPYWRQRRECPACAGTGLAPMAHLFRDQWYGYRHFDPVAYGAKPIPRGHPKILAMAERNMSGGPPGGLAVQQEVDRLYRDCFAGHWHHHLIQADVDALIAANRLGDFTREPRTEEQREVVRQKVAAGGNSWLPESNGYIPTAEEINEWSIGGMGHDGINASVCIEARCQREGAEYRCAECLGSGDLWPSPEVEAAYEAWEPTEPPDGPGYQLWQTTSEGSPASPVFATLEELCDWCAGNATTFASFTATAEEWREMLDAGFVRHKEGCNIFI